MPDVDFWRGGLRILASILAGSYQRDWMDAANCIVERHDDNNFIRKPSSDEAPMWEQICKQCPVSTQCMEWADREQLTGVYAAGEWRE